MNEEDGKEAPFETYHFLKTGSTESQYEWDPKEFEECKAFCNIDPNCAAFSFSFKSGDCNLWLGQT